MSSVCFVSSRAFAIDAWALLPALRKRSVSLMPWVRLLSALCADAGCAGAIGEAASREVSRTPAAWAIVTLMVLPPSHDRADEAAVGGSVIARWEGTRKRNRHSGFCG